MEDLEVCFLFAVFEKRLNLSLQLYINRILDNIGYIYSV